MLRLSAASSNDAAVFAVVVPVMLGLFILGIGMDRYKARQRRKRFQQWAAQNGYDYRHRDKAIRRLSALEPFNVGLFRRARHAHRGTYRGMRLLFFEYNHVPIREERSKNIPYQVVAIELPSARPLLDVGHENVFTQWLGRDIQFEHQEFNRRFRIRSDNPRFAHDIVNPRAMEWMLADPRARSNRWRFEGPWLMTFRPGALELEEVFFYADFLIDVYAQVPRHVWSNR